MKKVVWVTGGGSGIGEGVAVALAGDELHVVLSGRRGDALERVRSRILGSGGSASVEVMDVAAADAVDGAASRVLDAHGRIDVLVHSAGVNILNRSWEQMGLEDWQSVQRINLDGTFHVCRAVLPAMRKQGDGLIVLLSSWAGRFPSPLAGAAYSASKSGVNALAQVLNREEGKHGIRATAVCPGEVNTEILELRPKPPSTEQRNSMLQPEDIGELVRYLARQPGRVCVNEVLISPTRL